MECFALKTDQKKRSSKKNAWTKAKRPANESHMTHWTEERRRTSGRNLMCRRRHPSSSVRQVGSRILTRSRIDSLLARRQQTQDKMMETDILRSNNPAQPQSMAMAAWSLSGALPV